MSSPKHIIQTFKTHASNLEVSSPKHLIQTFITHTQTFQIFWIVNEDRQLVIGFQSQGNHTVTSVSCVLIQNNYTNNMWNRLHGCKQNTIDKKQ